jgi:G:T/U-mismatch repair DNA glycosylase
MTDKEQKARTKAAEEQNQKAQEEARRQIEEENERRLQAQRDAVGAEATTAPTSFQDAAKATEELNQPPNQFNTRELEQPASVTQPPAKNVNDTTLPESVQTPAREGEVTSPSQAQTENP